MAGKRRKEGKTTEQLSYFLLDKVHGHILLTLYKVLVGTMQCACLPACLSWHVVGTGR